MREITITIDDRLISAREGDILLWAALDNGVYIPHLCAHREELKHPSASCRLCFVEVQGRPMPVPACTVKVSDGLVVNTRSERVDALVAAGFELIMSNHRLDCKNCAANGNCGLQRIAKERKLRLKPKNLPVLERDLQVDSSADGIVYDPNKCVLCGHCIRSCRSDGKGILGFTRRGYDRIVTTFGDVPLGESGCNSCGACASACPVGAFAPK
ncbi:formate dehydrogenase major subunit [Desulfotomaculum arcticum]|uniref:Ferredoxin n=1 Tax=Desulfotruncus arcticus DSM 17038 TaxID=1121424 RepID=A0A1I2QBB5_9FIRM|nr:2Fe-2S iron-sulfur cluster-binding protein [Desulfotruncus arcticus]SFG25795.1 formate dehydrogenase major subunit [Desulfotomaculum arcticum] [Desulfotruncus arcticus DSM 17038]